MENGKTAVVTGGFGGIGLAVCKKLLENGISKLAIIDKDTQQDEVLNSLNQQFSSKHILFVKCDVSVREELEKSFKHIIDKFKFIDILVNSAGIFNDANVNLTLTVNIGGTINSSIIAANYMNKSKCGRGGVIITISSIVGIEPLFILPVYSASKQAIVSFTRSFSNDYYYEKSGVKVIGICPGATLTNFLEDFPNKMMIPDEEEALKYFEPLHKQSADELADHIFNIIETGKNGSIWICDNNEANEFVFPSK